MDETTLNKSEPLVSVLIPAYNAGTYLEEAVSSILNQTYPRIEVIVINDGSTDGSVDNLRASDPRLRVIHQENAGKPAALNRGLKEIRGEFYCLQDADDLSYPTRIENQLEFLLRHPNVAGVFCGYDMVLDGKHYAPTRSPKSVEASAEDIAAGHMPGHDPTAMYRLALVGDVRYAEDLPIVEGFDYVLRVGEQHPLAVVGDCLYSYRIHWESVTRRDPGRRDSMLQEAKRRMRERRGLAPDSQDLDSAQAVRGAHFADNNIHSHFMDSVAEQIASRARFGALKTAIACWRLQPSEPQYAKPLVYALLPASVVNAYRARAHRRRQAADLARLDSRTGGPS